MCYPRCTKIRITLRVVQSFLALIQPLSITKYLDKHLTPLIENTKSYIQDTQDFLSKIQDLTIPLGARLVTWDVANLYTAIPHTLGLEACKRLLHSSKIYDDRQITFLLELLTIALEDNFFLFKDVYYLQRTGTAMGSNVAPICQCVYEHARRSIHLSL